MSWPKVKLGDCCEVVSGATPKTGNPDYWGGDIPWVSPKSLSKLESKYLDEPTEYITKAGFDSCSTRMLPAMSLLLSCRAPVGLTAINRKPICTNQGFKSLIPDPKIADVNYLYHVMRKMRPLLEAQGRGATFTEVSKSIVERFEIPLPPLEEQKRIAAILDKVDSISKSTEQAKAEKEIVIHSLFTSLFGDVIQNTFDFPTRELGKIVSVNMGQSPSGESYNEAGEGTPFLQGNAEFTSLYPVHKKWTTEPNKMSKSGDILFSVRAPVGAVNIANQEYCIGRGLAAIEPNETVNQEYLQYCLFFMAKILQSKATGSTFKAVTGKTLKSFEIPIPPFPLQQKFASILSKTRDVDFEVNRLKSLELQKSTIQEMLT